MSFAPASFDTVFSFQVLEHVDDPEAVIGEMYRILSKGGTAIVTAPFLVSEHADPSDYQRFTTHGLRVRFERAGFEIVEGGPYGGLFAVCAEMLKFAWLNPYRPRRGRLRRFAAIQLVKMLAWFDKHSGPIGDNYTNVYLVARKR
jgi:SAM-dependent methyltransferase